MKKHLVYLLLSISIFLPACIFAQTTVSENISQKEQQSIILHMKLLREFKSMYEKKHFEKYLFDTKNGYLQTSLSNNDKMSLNFFVEYNNMWWYSIIEKVVVPSIAYDYENNTGFIVLDIYYDANHILRGTQYIKFTGDKISYIRTYGSPAFFSENDPLIKLDNYGNQIWLATGYDLNYSAKAALLFFNSPVGKSFADSDKTKAAVARIKKNLEAYIHGNNSKATESGEAN